MGQERAELGDQLHAEAICTLATEAVRAQRDGDRPTARIAHGAARLCEEIVGLWANPALRPNS